MRAFVASPPLATISFSKCVLLMVVSGGASVIQLPVLGWFSQIGIVAAAIAGFFGVPLEPATACAATTAAHHVPGDRARWAWCGRRLRT